MKFVLSILTLTLLTGMVQAQDKHFSNDQDQLKVYRGTTVHIDVDTAYVIGKVKAEFINQKIEELNEIKILYTELADRHNKLLGDLNVLQDLLEELKHKTISDSLAISTHFTRLFMELDSSLAELKINNEAMKKNNSELQAKTSQLEKLVKKLKHEVRGIWWDGVTDKIVVFGGGIGIGILLGLIL